MYENATKFRMKESNLTILRLLIRGPNGVNCVNHVNHVRKPCEPLILHVNYPPLPLQKIIQSSR
jgi:hypothetical protein